jgi:tetratricopeptide (TPR) repeat protein
LCAVEGHRPAPAPPPRQVMRGASDMNHFLWFYPSSSTRRTKHLGIFIGVLAFSVLLCGCRKKPAAVAVPKPNPEALQYITEGDAYFRQHHLYGWRKAEVSYRKACDLACSDELGKKLRLTRFLILIRQVDEDIPNPKAEAVVKELCGDGENQRDLCEIARWYGNYKKDRLPETRDYSIFKGEDSALETYFRLLLPGGSPQADSKLDPESLSDEFKASSLFLYLNPGRLKAKDPVEVETAYPEFAEAFEYLAESLFQRKKYGAARTYFRKAVEIIPDYTRAINGLGNIYFFALEDYERALHYYQSSLMQDSTNTAALFGVGAALHKLDRYEESNAALDRMLAGDLIHNSRLDSAGYHYYSGEGIYLKAYNYHLLKNPLRARELVDTARQFLPDSEEIIELSGMLYFEAKQLEEARNEFLRIIAKGNSNCNAQMHLGLIYRRLKQTAGDQSSEDRSVKSSRGYQETWSLRDESPEKKALSYFLGACSCMESGVRNLKEQMNSVPALDLEPNERVLLQDKLRYRLGEVRASCSSNIELMITEASEDPVPNNDRYLNLMREILGRIRNQ